MAERKYQFEWRTPTDNIDLDVYEDAINYVFENPDVKNLAISGAYSAGKSSVLASYKKNMTTYAFCIIREWENAILWQYLTKSYIKYCVSHTKCQ